MWKLVIEDDEGKRTVVPLTRDLYSIGRRDGNVIRLTERNVSREHARLFRKGAPRTGRSDDGPFVVEDLTSYNGVYVNGLRITHAHELAHGDLVQIGDYRVVLQNDSTAAATDPTGTEWKQTVPSAPQAQAQAAELLDRPNRFVMLAGPTPGAEFPLSGERLTIGRAEEADVSVNHNSVSRMHCEVHAIGDGRFEIVDKGSSNGVRVNGADLRRGIVEPGDLIELGDVRLKFVGAGQIFRPSEGQPFAAIPDRNARDVARRRGQNALPVAVFVTVVVAGGLGAWVYTRPRTSAPVTAAARSPEQAALAEAKRLCGAGDCDAAHAKLADAIPGSSRWRDTADFRDVESEWAESVLARADGAADPVARRELYRKVSQTVTVDPAHRKTAADRLQQLDAEPMPAATNAMELPVASAAPTASATATARSRADDAGPPVRDVPRRAAANLGGGSAVLAAGRAGELPAATVDDRERQLALKDSPDAKLVLKQQLEPRVFGGKASDAEIRLLISTCKDLGDRSCVQQARSVLAQRNQ